MFLQSLHLKNFRNHRDLKLSFSPKVNLIIGDNGIGKTNILEAIHLISTGKSFRTNHLSELICHGEDHFYIEACFIKENVSQILKIGYSNKKKKIEYNACSLYSFSHLLGILPSVLYSPKDISIIMGTPSERRRFLNIYLSQSDPLYVHHLLRYTKALNHRNEILKRKTLLDFLEISCFEKEMAISSVYILLKRIEAVKILQEKISLFMSRLTDQKEYFSVVYESSFKLDTSLTRQNLENQYIKQRPRELFAKSTLIGPHRDDFDILLKNYSIKSVCSEGQKRSFLNALKLSEWTLLSQTQKAFPLMCLDDLGMHLDRSRHLLLENELKHLGQIFITSPKNEFHYEKSLDQKTFNLQS